MGIWTLVVTQAPEDPVSLSSRPKNILPHFQNHHNRVADSACPCLTAQQEKDASLPTLR